MRDRIVNRIVTKQTVPERWVTLPNEQRHTMSHMKKKRLSDDELANILGKNVPKRNLINIQDIEYEKFKAFISNFLKKF